MRPGRSGPGLLVIGDEWLSGVADACRGRRHVVAHISEPEAASDVPPHWEELLIDGELLARIREPDRNLLAQAERVWVVTPPLSAEKASGNPFRHVLPPAGRAFKRALDIVVAAVGLVLALPVLLAAMVAVRVDTPGPVIFNQVRVGANGRRFRLYKLRTMHHGNDASEHETYVRRMIEGRAERCGEFFKLVHDPRVTRVGRILRRSSVDELLQLWNVLKGDMSLVGPRPPLPAETLLYSARAWQRLRVKPGLTGLWQVSGRCRLTFDEMVELDVRYWQRWSVGLELRILCRTPMAVLRGDGAA